jgi:hypothetical protein
VFAPKEKNAVEMPLNQRSQCQNNAERPQLQATLQGRWKQVRSVIARSVATKQSSLPTFTEKIASLRSQ